MGIKPGLLFTLVLTLFLSGGRTEAIRVAPGSLDHFALDLPEKIVAGESAAIKIQAQDAYNNLITNFAESGRVFKAAVSGSASVQPSYLPSASFQGGISTITISGKKAGKVIFYIYEADESVPLLMKEIAISPGKTDHFQVLAPLNVTAGIGFEAKIIVKDAFDNTISDAEIRGRNISLEPAAASDVKISGASVPDFRNGTASAWVTAEKTGRLSINVQDILTGSKGQSHEIIVSAALSEKAAGPVKERKEAQKKEPPKAGPAPLSAMKMPAQDKIKKTEKSIETAPEPAARPKEPKKSTQVPALKQFKKEEPKKPENVKPGSVFTINDISFFEAEGRVLLVINGTPSAGLAGYNYKNTLEKRQGREGLRIKMTPAARKIAGEVKLKSDMIEEVLIEDDRNEQYAVNIFIEFKAERPFFDISEQKNALVVMMSKTRF